MCVLQEITYSMSKLQYEVGVWLPYMGKHFTLTKVNDLLAVQPGHYQRYLFATRLGRMAPAHQKKPSASLDSWRQTLALGQQCGKCFPNKITTDNPRSEKWLKEKTGLPKEGEVNELRFFCQERVLKTWILGQKWVLSYGSLGESERSSWSWAADKQMSACAFFFFPCL